MENKIYDVKFQTLNYFKNERLKVKNMTKKLYFCRTNGYDMVVSVDSEGKCKYLTETEEFPYIVEIDKEQREKSAKEFLENIEDDSGWEDDCEYEQIFNDEIEIIVEIEKEM